ncbi:hypothetical protein [Chondrinema litorale]|uniref:hypothetical protein n=1 Tax=Chondrinema litorale TaxID=2994555 RepID=UPI002543EAD6|nr:hypothetical protein [Chondrinema litorale]UZR95932.1 hypothetical protein OQ292_08915 [Chondrinema litorale]
MVSVQIDSEVFDLAESVNELSKDQLLRLCELLDTLALSKEHQIKALHILFNLKWYKFRLAYLFAIKLDVLHIKKLLPYTDFLYNQAQLDINKIPSHKGLYGPKSRLENITFYEFIKAENYFTDYIKKGEIQALDKLIALLYREKKAKFNPKTDQDIRQPFNDMSHQWRVKEVARWQKKYKQAILLFYHSARKNLIDLIPKSKISKSTQNKIHYTWIHVMDDLAGNVIHIDQVGNMNVYTILFSYGKRIREMEAQNEKLKKL